MVPVPIRSLALLLPLAVAGASPAQAPELRLAGVFGDHMVLQRETQAPIFGTAAPGAEVVVTGSWMGDEPLASGQADADGRFRLAIATPPAGGPHEVTVRAGGEAVVLKDVLCGEVWICSGQSNMEWALRASDDAEAEIAKAAWPKIRLLTVPNRTAAEPASDLDAQWKACEPSTARDFSAVGYHFGRAVHEALQVPVGLIASDWGGTPAEAWTPLAKFDAETFPGFVGAVERVRAMAGDMEKLEADYQAARKAWEEGFGGLAPNAGGAWDEVGLPDPWSRTGLGDFDGIAFYRREVEVPAEWANRDLWLELGPIDDRDVTWFGEEVVGRTEQWNQPRRYRIAGSAVKGGKVTITVRAHDTGGEGGFVGKPEDLRLRPVEGEGGPLSLAGAWQRQRGPAQSELPAEPRRPGVGAHDPSSLYNGMIAPLAPLAIRGAIWYQGESNVGRHEQYEKLFPTMIQAWREAFDRPEMPFHFVQIAPFSYGGDVGQAAALRDAQRKTLQVLDHVGMAVTMDVGNPRDIHPRDKRTVGQRLALLALAQDYGFEGLDCRGPLFRDIAVEGGELRVRFDGADEGLVVLDGPLRCFQVAGEDRVFHDAEARIDGSEVVLTCAKVAAPIAVRFAFGAADQPNLFDKHGLPASSFRSDDWPLGR